MNYIVTIDDRGAKRIFHLEEIRVYKKFDRDDLDNDQVVEMMNAYLEKLRSLEGKVLGSGLSSDEDIKFIEEYIKPGGWIEVDTSRGVLLSGYFRFVNFRWLG